MSSKRRVSSIQLAEEAFRLIREDLSGFALYYLLGSIPFFAYLIYFIEEMSYGAVTSGKLLVSSFSLTVSYFWMRSMHSFACESARRHLQSDKAPLWSMKKFVIVFSRQVRLSGIALTFLLLASCIPFCFGLAFSYSQNLIAFAVRAKDAPECRNRSWKTALKMTGAAHRFLALYAGIWFIVWANIAILFYFLPNLMSSVFGIQNISTITGLNLLSTTFLTITLSLASIVTNAFSKSFHTLLCFKYESQETGEDLLAKLSQSRRRSAPAIALIAIALAGSVIGSAPAKPLEAAELQRASLQEEFRFDEQAENTLSEPEYAWRLPPSLSEAEDEDKSIVASFLDYLGNKARSLGESIEEFLDWLFSGDSQSDGSYQRSPSESYSGPGDGLVRAIAFIAIVVAVILIAVVLLGYKKDRLSDTQTEASRPSSSPDLEDETIQASDMPYDKWLALATEKANQQEYRLAIRAVFLATLSLLDSRQYIKISKSKANFEYARELNRRGIVAPAKDAFQYCRSSFDATWYGLHVASESQYVATRSHYDSIEQSTRAEG